MSKSAQEFVTPQYAEHAREMSGVQGNTVAAAGALYPLYGLGQAADAVVWYRRPMVVLPIGIAVGAGVGYLIWGMLLPNLKKNLRKSIAREED
jgi:hypothetical protein